MRDVLDELCDAHLWSRITNEPGRSRHLESRDHLLSIIRERFEAGDGLAAAMPGVAGCDCDTCLPANRHAAAVKACEEAAKGTSE